MFILPLLGAIRIADPAPARALFTGAAESAGFQIIKRPRPAAGAIWQESVGSPNKLLASYLRFWNVKAKRIRARGSHDAKTILKAHKEARGDLLVMGAYSHSRLSQRIFGGVTEFMLYKANIPVLMLHT